MAVLSIEDTVPARQECYDSELFAPNGVRMTWTIPTVPHGPTLMLRVETVATTTQDGVKRTIVQVPAGTILHALDAVPEKRPEKPTEQIDLDWNGTTVRMFLVDLQQRCERISEACVLGGCRS